MSCCAFNDNEEEEADEEGVSTVEVVGVPRTFAILVFVVVFVGWSCCIGVHGNCSFNGVAVVMDLLDIDDDDDDAIVIIGECFGWGLLHSCMS